MEEISANQVKIEGGFWGPRLEMNAVKALNHQWEQLERTGCIQNFRLVADQAEGIREGYFFADSDAYKWLDAAARVYRSQPSPALKSLMQAFIDLIGRVQDADGYIYTYNQLQFPGVRWQNLQIEHELYCHGHLIEAAVSHFEATGERSLLEIGLKAADLLIRDFAHAGPEGTPGHQEIEIALIRLYRLMGDPCHLDLASAFLERRGRMRPFISHILANKKSVQARGEQVAREHAAYIEAHPEHGEQFQLPGDNISIKPPWGRLRWFLNTASGKYMQQHQPIRRQTVPVGHAVRFAYQETAVAMLSRERGDDSLLTALEKAWDHMVARRMYVTGGTGSLPNIEGFGRDYELDPRYSYSETCAALGDIFWNWEMTLLSAEARYADLTEWQLYNAAAVGLGLDGSSYLYNNPLACEGGLTRQAWFKCPCCPSNLSRTWADLDRYLYSRQDGDIWIHQYVSSRGTWRPGLGFELQSSLPWEGKVRLTLDLETPAIFGLHFRIPSWSEGYTLKLNGEPLAHQEPGSPAPESQTACGYDPRLSSTLPLERTWSPGDVIEIEFELGITLRATHPRVRATRGQVAISRGPLVYCLESNDNPGVDLFNLQLDPASLHAEFSPDHFGGITLLRGRTSDGRALTFIPYTLWANRGESQMTVYINLNSG